MAVIDETGHVYGILTVLERAPNDKHGKACWKCQCECGKIIIVEGCALRKGNTKSCGCRRLSAETAEIGKQYGELTVISCAGRTSSKKILWNCQCSCGNITQVPTGALHSGATKTCGHHFGGKNIINEIGNKYGLLIVLSRAEHPTTDHSTDAFWLCQCECGNQIVVSGSRLRSGNTKSCGCIKSIGEYNIIQLLKQNNIPYKTQVSFSDLIYKAPLKYDFGIYDTNHQLIRLIEFDGPQHNNGNQWYTSEVGLRDQMKNIYAKTNNIPLIRIPYKLRDTVTLDDIYSNKYLI